MVEYKPEYWLKLYKQEFLDYIYGTAQKTNESKFPLVIKMKDKFFWMKDGRYFHTLTLDFFNTIHYENKKETKLNHIFSLKDNIPDGGDKDLSSKVTEELYKLVCPLIIMHNRIGSRWYILELSRNIIEIKLR